MVRIHPSFDSTMKLTFFALIILRVRKSDNMVLSEGSVVPFAVQSCHHAHGVFFMDAEPLASARGK